MTGDEVRYSSLDDNIELIQPVLTSERTPRGCCTSNPACYDPDLTILQGWTVLSFMLIFATFILVLFLTGHISNIEKTLGIMYPRFNRTNSTG